MFNLNPWYRHLCLRMSPPLVLAGTLWRFLPCDSQGWTGGLVDRARGVRSVAPIHYLRVTQVASLIQTDLLLRRCTRTYKSNALERKICVPRFFMRMLLTHNCVLSAVLLLPEPVCSLLVVMKPGLDCCIKSPERWGERNKGSNCEPSCGQWDGWGRCRSASYIRTWWHFHIARGTKHSTVGF